MGRVISNLLWLGALVGVVVGTFLWIDSMLSAKSAPQQGALAAMAATAAILPYVAARAIDAMRRNEAQPPTGDRLPDLLPSAAPPKPAAVPERIYSAEDLRSMRARAKIALAVAGVAAVMSIALAIWAHEASPGASIGAHGLIDLVDTLQATMAAFAIIGLIAGFYGVVEWAHHRCLGQ